MNVKKCKLLPLIVLVAVTGSVCAESARKQIAEGNTLYEQGNYDKAAKKYEQALKENPEAAEAQYNKGNSLYRQEDFDAAIEAYQKAAVQSQDP